MLTPVKNITGVNFLKNKNGKQKYKTNFMTYNDSPSGLPETCYDMVNQYGTYEIQTTADTDNVYPAIAQGFNKKAVKTDRQNLHGNTKKW